MKLIRTLSNTAIFFTGLALFYVLIIFALSSVNVNKLTLLQVLTGDGIEPGGWGDTLLKFRELQSINHPDILFIGSSRAYRGYDPRIFQAKGYSSFNLGTTSQTPMNTYFLLRHYIRKLKPKLIVFDLDFRSLSMDGYESTLDLLANVPISWELLEMSLTTGNPHAVANFIGKFIRDQKYPLTQFDQTNIPDETYIPGGYVETSMFRRGHPEKNTDRIYILNSQLGYCSKINELAKNSNIPIVEVIQPMSEDFIKSVSYYKTVVNKLRNMAEKYKVIFLNFNGMVNLDPIFEYKDRYHLNKKGVLKYNEILLDKLIAIKALLPNE